jgi:hypothetical protein
LLAASKSGGALARERRETWIGGSTSGGGFYLGQRGGNEPNHQAIFIAIFICRRSRLQSNEKAHLLARGSTEEALLGVGIDARLIHHHSATHVARARKHTEIKAKSKKKKKIVCFEWKSEKR